MNIDRRSYAKLAVCTVGILATCMLSDCFAQTAASRFEKAEPNDMWQMDYKGWFRMAGGQKCHPLNVIDDHSRFCVRSVALP